MAQTVMTNNGRKSARKGSGRNPLAEESEWDAMRGPELMEDPALGGSGGGAPPFVRSSSVTLPPLTKSTRAAETLDSMHGDFEDGVSPARRGRKKSLQAYGEGTARSIIQASLDVDQREKEMTLARENRREYGRLLLELWVNQVLDPGGASALNTGGGDLSTRAESMQLNVTMLKGLASFGLTRTELLGAGLSNDAVDRLYRCLYVYTIGFFDVMQDILQHSEFRVEILSNVWRAFLFIAEAALKVAFKSDYLQLFQAQQITAAELLVAKEALAEARQDSYNTEKALAWLTSAHAEERALRQAVKAELEGVQEALERERRAHQAAVAKFVGEMEARARLQLEVEARDHKLEAAASAYTDIILQRDGLQEERDTLEDRCVHVLSDVSELYAALIMDDTLKAPQELLTAVSHAPEGMASLKAKSSVVKELVNQLYTLFRNETVEHKATRRELYMVKDALRVSRSETIAALDSRGKAQGKEREAIAEMERQTARADQLQAELHDTLQQLAEMTAGKIAAEDEVARLQAHTVGLEQTITTLSAERDQLDALAAERGEMIEQLQAQVSSLESSLAHSQWLAKELSKGFAVTARALTTNQAARNVLQRNIRIERDKLSKTNKQLDMANRQIRVLDGKVETLELEKAEMSQALSVAEAQAAQRADALAAAAAEISEQNEKIRDLELRWKDAQLNVDRLTSELDRTTKVLTSTEDALKFEKEEVTRLYEALQAAEKQLREAAEERQRLTKKVERSQQELKMAEDKFKRREETLSTEIKRLQAEVRLERTHVSSLELQVEAQRKKVDEGADALARKREKKKRWKRMCQEAESSLRHLKGLLDERDLAIGLLDARLRPLETDLAILCADRGRPLPRYEAPKPSTISHGESTLSQQARAVQRGTGRAAAGTPPPAAPGSKPGTAASSGGSGLEGPASLAELGVVGEGDVGDNTQLYAAWDAINKQALSLQVALDQENKAVEVTRRAYDKARAIFYTNPTDKTLQERMESREADLNAARLKRTETEQQLDALIERGRNLHREIREYESGLAKERMKEVEWRTGQRELALRSEMSSRLDEAEGRMREVTDTLAQQRIAYDMLQATRTHLEGELAKIEAELKALSSQLSRAVADKLELEGALRAAKSQVTYLQAEMSAISRERDNQKGAVAELEGRIQALQTELDSASSSVSHNMKRMEAKFDEERSMLVRMANEERSALQAEVADRNHALEVLREAKKALETALSALLGHVYEGLENSLPPVFLWQLKPRPVVEAAESLVPDFERITSFPLTDIVTAYIAPPFESTLVTISQLYTTKMIADLEQEEFLLGGRVGPRANFETIVYTFFSARYGTRQAAEMHLAAFLGSVMRFRNQHPKIRVFARLLGLGDDPLPPQATEFYIALLNRIHSRAGPLVAEAAEGFSLVKCKIVAKACREMLRGAFANVNDDAANLSDTLRHMALNDEEKQIDLEISAEMALKAWWAQYGADTDSALMVMKHHLQGRDPTPDDFMLFLRQLDSVKADTLEPRAVQAMYCTAIRGVGPSGGQREVCRALVQQALNEGFIGMSSYRQRLEPVRSPPPYDEFRSLEDAWRPMRAVVEAQVEALRANKEAIRADVASYVELVRRLEQQLELREAPDVPWALYRKLLTVYLGYRKQVDKLAPFKPPITPTSSILSSLPNSMFNTPRKAEASESGAASPDAPGSRNISPARGRSASVRRGSVVRRSSFGKSLVYTPTTASTNGGRTTGLLAPRDEVAPPATAAAAGQQQQQ